MNKKLLVLILILIFPHIIIAEIFPDIKKETIVYNPEEKFYHLSALYYLWTENFYKADNHYRREIIATLHTYLNEKFTTPQITCFLDRPIEENGYVYSVFLYEKWLEIVISVEEEAYKKVLSSSEIQHRTIGMQLIISGSIKKYLVVNNSNEKKVRIYLHNIDINYLKPVNSDIK